MNCEKCQDLISDFLDGSLSREDDHDAQFAFGRVSRIAPMCATTCNRSSAFAAAARTI